MPHTELPSHLKRYVVEQDYSRYTSVDQEVWRYIMRRLKAFLSVHAHPCYVEGLEKTGISTERIPDIRVMSEKLEKFGWRAIPVSGFIPPAAFMELQALGFLPIASDMRTIDHMSYTPAPDIVHEAAGHAPILVDPEFAAYLKSYAQVARKAIIGRDDMDQYEAIRVLSDLKEDPASTPEQIRAAEEELERVSKSIAVISEAALLGRMNWWTAEYGLIGTLENPRIFGAGLLSSMGEAEECLKPKVKKVPLTIDCINYAYDITEPQPQLFVTPDFNRLREVLEELASKMAYRLGGSVGLERARQAQTVNSIELNSGLQISGVLSNFITADSGEPAYLQIQGPAQLCYEGRELKGHGKDYHADGFGSPVGLLEGESKCLSQMTDDDLRSRGIVRGERVELRYRNGTHVRGEVSGHTRAANGRLMIVAFNDCTVTRGDQCLFQPAWGTFDMAVGSTVTSVFSGPADRAAYGEAQDFVAKFIPRKTWSPEMQRRHSLYQEVREVREGLASMGVARDSAAKERLMRVWNALEGEFKDDWLLRLSLLELEKILAEPAVSSKLRQDLDRLALRDPTVGNLIQHGLKLL